MIRDKSSEFYDWVTMAFGIVTLNSMVFNQISDSRHLRLRFRFWFVTAARKYASNNLANLAFKLASGRKVEGRRKIVKMHPGSMLSYP